MDTSTHTFNALFEQLGLPSSDTDVESFVAAHQPLGKSIALSEASFWSATQAEFLKQAIKDDSDWAEVVDQLDARLR